MEMCTLTYGGHTQEKCQPNPHQVWWEQPTILCVFEGPDSPLIVRFDRKELSGMLDFNLPDPLFSQDISCHLRTQLTSLFPLRTYANSFRMSVLKCMALSAFFLLIICCNQFSKLECRIEFSI